MNPAEKEGIDLKQVDWMLLSRDINQDNGRIYSWGNVEYLEHIKTGAQTLRDAHAAKLIYTAEEVQSMIVNAQINPIMSKLSPDGKCILESQERTIINLEAQLAETKRLLDEARALIKEILTSPKISTNWSTEEFTPILTLHMKKNAEDFLRRMQPDSGQENL